MTRIAYLCDKTKCEHACSSECRHTTDINHAVNFRKVGENAYMEMGQRWRKKPLPKATHCIVAIKWDVGDIEVTEQDTTFLSKDWVDRIIAWMPLPEPPKEVFDDD